MSFESYEHLRFERREHGVLLVTMDRPERLNATNARMHSELAGLWRVVGADEATRVVVVTGAGKAFSAGGDLEMIDRLADYDHVAAMTGEVIELVMGMVNCPKPIVSAINGTAVGAGLSVALMADISVIAEDARLTDGHSRLGVVAGDHAAVVWPLLCGMAKAKYYLLTCEPLTGEEAERIGLVSLCVDDDQVHDKALDIAVSLRDGAQSAIRWTKQTLNNWYRANSGIFDASLAYEFLGFGGPDAKEGLASHMEKRPPNFRP
jgi:enoyl-CoA hydratase